MADVTVRLPGLLARFADGEAGVAVAADTVGESLDRLVERYPAVEPHLFAAGRRRREHLRLFLNGEALDPPGGVTPAGPGDDPRDRPLADGDEVLVLQAVSGG